MPVTPCLCIHLRQPMYLSGSVYVSTCFRSSLGPDEYSVLKVTYNPKHSHIFSSENFTLSTAGGNKLTLHVCGNAVGPQLHLSATSFNFGSIKAGQQVLRVLYLDNSSEVPVVYEFKVDQGDVFTVSKPRGVVPPKTVAHTSILFKATTPANYWRRVVCLVKVRYHISSSTYALIMYHLQHLSSLQRQLQSPRC